MAEGASQAGLASAMEPGLATPETRAAELRLWPAVVLMVLQWLFLTIPPLVAAGTMVHFMSMMWSPMVAGVGLILWWLFASRARWRDRWLVLVVTIAAAVAAIFLCDRSVPMLLLIRGLPWLVTLWAGWLLLTRHVSWPARRLGLLATIVATLGYYTLIRVDGTDGYINATTSWRWARTSEQEFLASRSQTAPGDSQLTATTTDDSEDSTEQEPTASAIELEPGDWPEFRGPHRDNRLSGVTILDDWKQAPPKRLWKTRLGPGWGSFAVVGDRLFTQEQRGDDEVVVCYRATDGQEQWVHGDATRFWEVIAGAGPRATPTFHEGRIYSVGANGRLNCLDAATGKVIWATDMVPTSEVEVPQWGYCSSPLIVGELVLVLPGRPNGSAVHAYDRATGQQVWSAGDGTHAYSSPQLAEIDGVPQILSQTDQGMTGLDPSSGRILWHDAWLTDGAARVLQPFVEGNTVLVTTYFGIGSRLVRVNHIGDTWSTETVWETKDFKPYFNDFVVHDGYAYGFDANLFCCLDLKTGKRAWKGGRYGHGQVLLVTDQKLLLVLSEQGEMVLVKADPKKHTELGRFQALEGKTWNHPVIVRGKLYVRNAEEMACYDVAPRERVAARE